MPGAQTALSGQMKYPSTPTLFQHRDLRPPDLGTADSLLQTYAWMQLARTTDNRILELFRQGLIHGTVTGGQGNEGLIVPLTLLADKDQTVIKAFGVPTYPATSMAHRSAYLIKDGKIVYADYKGTTEKQADTILAELAKPGA